MEKEINDLYQKQFKLIDSIINQIAEFIHQNKTDNLERLHLCDEIIANLVCNIVFGYTNLEIDFAYEAKILNLMGQINHTALVVAEKIFTDQLKKVKTND